MEIVKELIFEALNKDLRNLIKKYKLTETTNSALMEHMMKNLLGQGSGV